MGFTVTIPGGTKNFEFDAYARLLRQSGVDLGNLPRSPDPTAPQTRWLYVWPTEDDARTFRDKLKEQARASGWEVMPTHAPPSHGPYGPVLIQLVRRSDGLVFAIHPISSAMIRAAMPGAKPQATSTFISAADWHDYQKKPDSLGDLVMHIAPPLTGLDLPKLTELGYAVIDSEHHETLIYVAPSDPIPSPGTSGSSAAG